MRLTSPRAHGRDSAPRPVAGALGLALASLLAGCTAMESAPPERLAALRTRAQACSEALPALSHYDIDRFGAVRASAQGAEAQVIERNFHECLGARGRWASWAPGQPAPMLEPLGPDAPTPGSRLP